MLLNHKLQYNKKENQFIFLTLILVLLVTVLPDIAFASTSTNSQTSVDAVDTTICSIIEVLQGNIARGVAAFGIIFLGFSLFLGKISWGTALALGIGIGAIFGAKDIVRLIGDGTEACKNVVTNINNTTE